MNDQPELFPEPSSRARAAHRRDIGIQSAGDHADAVREKWREDAARLILIYATTHGDFLAEDVVEYAKATQFDDPPDGRAWGAAIKHAKSRSFIEACGYRPAKTSNLSPKVLWRLHRDVAP